MKTIRRVKGHHKYLNDIGIESDGVCVFNRSHKRTSREKKYRETYGFDASEVFDLDYTLSMWLYCHLKALLDTGKIIDRSVRTFTIPVLEEQEDDGFKRVLREVSEQKAIELAIEYLKTSILEDLENDITEKSIEYARCALRIVEIILPCLWW